MAKDCTKNNERVYTIGKRWVISALDSQYQQAKAPVPASAHANHKMDKSKCYSIHGWQYDLPGGLRLLCTFLKLASCPNF